MKKVFLSFLCAAMIMILISGCAGTFTGAPQVRKGTVNSFDGVPIYYEVQGSSTPAIVFVHGWCCDRTYWDAQVAYFARTNMVVTIDLAGHGKSGVKREIWSMGAFGEDVRAVLEELGLKQIVLVGHSMGGPVILEAALRLKGRVAGLVAVDTLNQGYYLSLTKEQIEGFAAPFLADFAAATDSFVRQSFFTPDSDPALIERIASDMSSAPPAVGLGTFGELAKWDLRPALQEVKAPIRCISLHGDPKIEALFASYFDIVHMSGVGHFAMMEDPEGFNHLLRLVSEFRSQKLD